MTKNAITWIREDFRIENNPALSYATQNHENVLALFIYNKNDFDKNIGYKVDFFQDNQSKSKKMFLEDYIFRTLLMHRGNWLEF